MDSHRPLHVAIVAASPRIRGGQSHQAQRIMEGFADRRDVVAWLVPIDPELPKPFNRLLRIKYLRTVLTQLVYWPLLFLELRRADVVHVFSASYLSFLLSPLPAVLVARLLGKPVLLNYHSGEAPDHLRRSALARFVLRRVVSLNVVPSPFLEHVFASFGIPALVVFNSIDIDAFAGRVREPIRPHLLSTRSLESLYNVACTLRAFAVIQRQRPDATLTLLGGGSQEAALKQLAADLRLRNVRFVGSVPPEDVRRHYADADIYVQTPSIDNMPLSVLEAFANGLPVVSTAIGGVPAILTDGEHGYLAADDDPEDVARQVLALLRDPHEARRRALAAQASCERYRWSAVRDGWIAAYRSVTQRHGEVAAAIEGRL